MAERKLKGVPLSSGVGIGRILLLRSVPFETTGKEIDQDERVKELERFTAAHKEAKERLLALKKNAEGHLPQEEMGILEAHLLMIDDPMLIGGIKELIAKGKLARDAVVEKTKELKARLESLPDPYMRERAIDIEDVGLRLFRALLGIPELDLSATTEPIVLTAEELTPSETAGLKPDRVAAIVTARGGVTSHAAIIAKALGIPAVSGISTKELTDQTLAIVYGDVGTVILNPSEETIQRAKRQIQRLAAEKRELASIAKLTAETKDGTKLELWGNIASPEEVDDVRASGGTGIGLFRTEFLYMDRPQPPTEEEQLDAYAKALKAMGDRPVVIRTLDVGGDKEIPYLSIEKEGNPFLGYRAIRLCLENEELFLTQLRALLRSSVYGKLWIMFPMISSIWEVRQAKEMLEKAKIQLKNEGKGFDEDIKVGIMIETPAAAIISRELAAEVDFFSIGTNDLTQYTLAVDRTNQRVNRWFDSFHPAVLRLIAMTAEGAHAHNIDLGVCGEMAGEELAIPIFVGLGFNELSMAPARILWQKRTLRATTSKWAKEITAQALKLSSAQEVYAFLKTSIDEIIPTANRENSPT
ncbi:phosphoenolpyruvate--protein phosphotransferase [Acetomicrobium sp. S15 = DSM 107314]|uniref:phosphoenolpyruvate--protein phosphotransferase n=1 Tax=Acetomicrobium sp. S15 = DSM 107314 TaxID=2529858 RepID=UPI0018E16F47|nr:phosphoenolpyruvate--protein phosphotransferase [Acetomicrobium sp. S15 = DSM 107314]